MSDVTFHKGELIGATGFMSTVIPVILVAAATVVAYLFGNVLGIAISTGFSGGFAACSARVLARPFQN